MAGKALDADELRSRDELFHLKRERNPVLTFVTLIRVSSSPTLTHFQRSAKDLGFAVS